MLIGADNAGSAFAAFGTAGYAWGSTTLFFEPRGSPEVIRASHYTAAGAASGMVTGFVGITPGIVTSSLFVSMDSPSKNLWPDIVRNGIDAGICRKFL
ncbi:putative ammonium transporter [Bifidobacterium bohemicum DSM 22767]|uniref:Putative ammonium transporter n=1 Tax=Bifidobacterium bohemicum DSM 22767 TaxID=1437606 RepID=A0A086ZHR4_9BIFI|nr:putative ammonium transporter [Bifidobacterium bohemicum DSM 22767]